MSKSLSAQSQSVTMVDAMIKKKEVNAKKEKIKNERRRLEALMAPAVERAYNPLIKELINSFNMSSFVNTNDFTGLKTKETIINFIKILNRKKVDISMLRSLSFRGIPNEIKGLRPLVWKVLLGYLPRETSKWEEVMEENKKDYASLRGLTAMVTRRRKLLEYLLREDLNEFQRLTDELGIRTNQLLKPKLTGARGRRV